MIYVCWIYLVPVPRLHAGCLRRSHGIVTKYVSYGCLRSVYTIMCPGLMLN